MLGKEKEREMKKDKELLHDKHTCITEGGRKTFYGGTIY